MRLVDFVPFIPEILLALASFVLLLSGAASRRTGARSSTLLVLVALVVTGAAVLLVGRPAAGPEVILGGMLVVDQMAVFFKLLFLLAAALGMVMSASFLDRFGYRAGEYGALLLTATLGMFVMASGANLASLYVGLELMALSVYILVGYFKLETTSVEGAVKYFVLGALSSGILLYGISLVYGATGSLDLETIRISLETVSSDNLVLLLGIVLVAFGMLFKVAAVPFHVWTPDAYQGAPTPVTAFISVVAVAGANTMFLRLFAGTFAPEADAWRGVLWVVAAATMIYGNVAALTQDNVKRMLAYSSIAHAGYALLGLVASSAMGTWSLLLYMLVYTFMNLGAFGFVILLESRGYAGERIADFAGLARRAPAAAACMLLFMLALAVIPPTAGFIGKLYLFAAAVEAGYVGLVVIAVVMSAVSLYYYFRIVLEMYLRDASAEGAELVEDRWTGWAIGACAVVTLAIGVYPAPAVAWAMGGLNALGLI